jgi:hypothetical protein
MTVLKLNLMGSGFFAFPDEVRYKSSEDALQKLAHGQIAPAINAVFATEGRPADAFIKMLPMTVQFITAKVFKLNYFETHNSYPIFIWNFIIYCCILSIHFKFSKLLLKDEFLALVSVVLLGSLTNSYMYLRHAIPYDASLLIFYLILYKTLVFTESNSLTFRNSFLLGFSGFFGYLVYPGYFPLFITAVCLLFFNRITRETVFIKFRQSITYALGSVACLAVFEGVSRLGGGSYIADAVRLAGTVVQGSFEESFTFIFKYLFEVEGLKGIVLIIGLALFGIFMVFNTPKMPDNSAILVLGIALVSLFLAYASAGYFLHKMVFYGRLLHQYFPFIVIFLVYSIHQLLIKLTDKPEPILALLSFVFIINFGFNFLKYTKSFAYPRDIAWTLSKTHQLKNIESACEYPDSWSVIPVEEEHILRGSPKSPTDTLADIILVNACYFYPIDDRSKYQTYTPKSDERLIDSKPHFMNFKAYQYEGYGIAERQNVDAFKLEIKTFSRIKNVRQ